VSLQHALLRIRAQATSCKRSACPGQKFRRTAPPARPPSRRGWPAGQQSSRNSPPRGTPPGRQPPGRGRGQAAARLHSLHRQPGQASWAASKRHPQRLRPRHTLGPSSSTAQSTVSGLAATQLDGRDLPRLASRAIADPGGPLQHAIQSVRRPSRKACRAGQLEPQNSSWRLAPGRPARSAQSRGCRASNCRSRPQGTAAPLPRQTSGQQRRPLFSHLGARPAKLRRGYRGSPPARSQAFPEFAAIPASGRHSSGLAKLGRAFGTQKLPPPRGAEFGADPSPIAQPAKRHQADPSARC